MNNQQLAAHTNFNTNLSSFMIASKMGGVPVRMQGRGIEWGPIGHRQAAISPALGMEPAQMLSTLGLGDAGSRCRLFECWDRLQVIRQRVLSDVTELPRDLRKQSLIMKAELTADIFTRSLLLASAGTPYTDQVASEAMWSEVAECAGCEDFLSAALIGELATEMAAATVLDQAMDRDLYSRVSALWLNSLGGDSAPEIERFKLSRGILYGFGGARPAVYRDVLLESAEAHAQEGRMDESAQDIVRIVRSISHDANPGSSDWSTASSMLESAAEVFEEGENDDIEIDRLISLAVNAAELAALSVDAEELMPLLGEYD